MNYIEWNKHLWDYFFKPAFKDTDQKIVLAVNKDLINEIGKANNLSNSLEDFICAINDGPSDIVDGIEKFNTPKKNLDILSKAKYFIDNPKYITRIGPKILRWSKSQQECLITAYLAYLVLMITDENKYWSNVKSNLNPQTSSSSQNYTTEMFEYFKKWANDRGFQYFYKNIYTVKKNVGTIFSQLPLTVNEEKQIVASLYDLKTVEPQKYPLFKEDISFNLVEQFIEDQNSFLNKPTAKELNDYSSELRSVVIDYVFQNFGKYIQACEDASDEEMKVILEERKSARDNFKPEFFLCINDNKIKGLLLVNMKFNSSLKEGELTFKCGKVEFKHNTRFSFNVNDDNGENYKAYFLEIRNKVGTYKIFSGEIDTKYTFIIPPIPDFKTPIWYRDYSRSNPALKLISFEKKIKFDINNPYKIITQKDYEFSSEKINKYGIKSLGNNFQIGIGDSNYAFQINTISLVGIDDKFKLGGKEIEITNKELDFIIQGAPDGKRGKASFLSNVPITINFNPTYASNVKIKNSKGDEIQYINENHNHFDTIYSKAIQQLSEGDYIVEVLDPNNKNILKKEFSISVGNISEQRTEKYLEYKVCDFKKLSTEKIIEHNQTNSSITIKQELIEELIDILIKGKKLTSIYDKDFKYVFNTLLKKHDLNDTLSIDDIDTLELSKIIIYLLDSLNIIEREVHYIKTIIKPYWIASSIYRSYNLIGALASEDIKELDGITSIKSRSQCVHRIVNKKLIAIELPRQFFLEKCDETKIPKTDKYPLDQNYKSYDFEISEPIEEKFEIESLTLKFSILNYSGLIPINNIKVMDWFTLKYEAVNQDQFKEMLSYWGYKLIEIESKKNYNNRIVKYYFLFSINESGIYYSYFPYEQRDKALRLYLKKVKYFDLSHLILNERMALDKNIELLTISLISNGLTNKEHKNILIGFKDNKDDNTGLKKIINFQNAFKLDLVSRGIIKSFFQYDKSKQNFAINSSVPLPEFIDKYLIGISGLLPIYVKQKAIVPNSQLDQLFLFLKDTRNTKNIEEKEIVFRVYQNIPEEVVGRISNNLLSSRMHMESKNYLEIRN